MDRRQFLAGLSLAALAGCARVAPGATPSTVLPSASRSLRVGSDGTAVGDVLSALFVAALAAHRVAATPVTAPGALDQVVPALGSGRVQVLPAFAASLLAALAPGDEPPAADEVAASLATLLDPQVVVLRAVGVDGRLSYVTAPGSGLASLSDLRARGKDSTLIGPDWLATAPDGPAGLETVYGVDFARVEAVTDVRERFDRLRAGSALVGVFRAPEVPPDSGLTVLADPELLVAPDPQVVLVTPEVAGSDEEVLALDEVQELLTTQVLASLAGRVLAGAGADAVAKEWLAGQPR